MIDQKKQNEQLPEETLWFFKELRIFEHLKQAGLKKCKGFTCAYLFQLLFSLVFHQKNLYQYLQSKKGEGKPEKNAIYRFLNHPKWNWRQFLLLLGAYTVQKVSQLTSASRISAFIVDDSSYERNRSKKVELLARCKDHTSHKPRYYKGFRMLTLGWSDGFTFIPVDFTLLSSVKTKLQDIIAHIDRRTCGYKRRLDALETAPDQVVKMLDRALRMGISAPYVLMDSWFTHQALVQEIVQRGLDVIGMVKATKQGYIVGNRKVCLKELYYLATPVSGQRGILRSIHTQLSCGLPVKVVFVQHRSKSREWLAILSTDCTLTEKEIIQTYGIRWDIEVFFKCTKSLLRLQKDVQGRYYDAMVSHTTIVFTRYIVLAWQHRCSSDDRTLGGLFYELCDEIHELDWAIALQQLIELLMDVMHKTSKKITNLIKSQLQQWIDGLPLYIKAYLPNLT